MAHSAVSASAYSQKPNPRGFPVSRSNIKLLEALATKQKQESLPKRDYRTYFFKDVDHLLFSYIKGDIPNKHNSRHVSAYPQVIQGLSQNEILGLYRISATFYT
jgi:hypothetical protein